MIITKAEAKQQGLTQYFTGKPCKRGHLSHRNVTTSNCLECWREDSLKKRKADPEAFKAMKKAEYNRNKESILAQQKEYRQANWDRIYAKRKANPNYRKYMSNYICAYLKHNDVQRAKHLARTRRRQLSKHHQTPEWAKTPEAIREMELMYIEARRLTVETGIPHEVDHIVPLQGTYVCGFHCPDNLQIITEHENRTKWNYHKID